MKTFPQKLPPEILTQIFEWIYFISVGKPGPDIVDGQHVRQLCWPVSQVCKYWREVALAAPFLWTYLPTINLDDDKSPSPSQQLERLEALIPRTRNRGLHIRAVGSNDEDFDNCLKVVDYIVQYCERWETLSVRASPDYLDYYFEEINGSLPRLEILKLQLLEGDGAELTLFNDAPNLKSVHITGNPAGWIFLDTRALRHLYDDTAMILTNLEAIHGFQNLTTLEVFDTGESFDYSELSDDDVVVFPTLKSLDYSCHDEFPADFGFLGFAETPALEELSIIACEGDVLGGIMDLHSRSGSLPLKRLHLQIPMDNSHEQALLDLLRLFPELESLDIHLSFVRNISRLPELQGTEVLLPKLRKCTIHIPLIPHIVKDDDVHHDIARIAESRCNRPQRLGPNANTSTHPTVPEDITAVCMQLCLRQDLGGRQFSYPSVAPVKLESWYHSENKGHIVHDTNPENWYDRSWRRSYRDDETVYVKLVSEILDLMLRFNQGTDSKCSRYKRILDLITKLEDEYESENLVDFLAENTSACLVYLAFVLKTDFSHDVHISSEAHPYGQVVHILKRVKSDLLQRLDKFHWAWEIHPEACILQYIHDHHENRADPDKFANAILGLSNDLWIFEDL